MENLSQVLLFIIMGLICVIVIVLRRLKMEKQEEIEKINNKNNAVLSNMLRHMCTNNGVTAGISVIVVEEVVKVLQWEVELSQSLNPNPKISQKGLVVQEREVVKNIIELIEDNKYYYKLPKVFEIVLEVCNSIKVPISTVLQTNIEKLKKRYPNGFTISDSINKKDC